MKFTHPSLTQGRARSLSRVLPLLAIVSCAPGDHEYASDAGDAASAGDIVSTVPSAAPTSSPVSELQPPSREQRARAEDAIARLPLTFVRNEGQFDEHVRYLARTTQGVVALRDNGFSVAMPVQDPSSEASPPSGVTVEEQGNEHSRRVYRPIDVRFEGSTPTELPVGEEPSTSVSNYYIGNDHSRWREQVAEFNRVRFPGAYRGIDVVYYGNEQHLEYDFVVAPGVDPSVVSLSVAGADSIETTAAGSLNIHVADRSFEISLPRTYQDLPTGRREIPSHFVLDSAHSVARIALGAYDPTVPLVIDPVLTIGTYVGGTGSDRAIDLAVDSSNNIYLFGATTSTDYPTTSGVAQPALAGDEDFFVTKLDPTMSSRLFSTYVGGTWIEWYSDGSYVNGHSMGGGGLFVDGAGNTYFTGSTASSDYPLTAGALQTVGPPASLALSTTPRYFSPLQCDSVVTKLSSTGTLAYSTYLGGTGRDSATGVAVDSTGNAYVVGFTDSSNFPVTAGAFQTTNKLGDTDLFVAKINATGTALVYATYLGGTGEEDSGGIVVDTSGRAAITGETTSSNYPAAGAGDATFGGMTDGVLTVLNAGGTALVNSGYLGGTGAECAFSINNGCTAFGGSCSFTRRTIAIDSTNNLYVTCATSSADFPTTAGLDTTLSGSADLFLMKLAPAAASVTFSTFVAADPPFPTGITRYAATIALQPDGTPTLTWTSNSSGEGTATYPTSCMAGQCATGRFSTSGVRQGVMTSNLAFIPRGTVDSNGLVYWFGTSSASITTPGVVQPTAAGGGDAWLGRLIIDQASASSNCLPCNGSYGSGTSNACPSATPTCVTSGANAGSCVAPTACTSNAQCSGATPVCNTATSVCVAAAVALTNPPANGSATTSNPTPTITGTGVPGQTVTVTSGPQSICTAVVNSAGSWACVSSTLTVGSHTITATSGGATSMGTLVVQCTVDSQCSGATPACNTATHSCVAAAVSLTNPPAGGSVSTTSTTPAITGTGVPGGMVTVTDGTTTICTATVSATGTWTCTPATPLAVGSHTITATAGSATSTGTLVVQCTMNTQCSGATPVCNTASHACVAAAVALTSPPAGGSVSTTDTTPTLTGTGVPGATVTVTDGATTICTATVSATGTWTCTPTTPLAVGSHALTATSNGATSMGTVVIQCTLSTQCSGATPICNTATSTCVAATVALTSPPSGGSANTTNTMPAITGTGIPGAMVTVTDGATTLCTATVSVTGTWTCTPTAPLSIGSHTITATSGGASSMGTLVVQCTMNAQCSGATPVCNTATSACVAASVTLTNPPAGGSANTTSTTPAITGTGVPGAMVTVTSGTTTLCTATVTAAGTWTCTSSALTVGSHAITATSNGATSMGTLVVQCTMNTQCSGATPVCNTATHACVAATVALTSPPAGGSANTTDTTPTLTGTGVPGATVTVTDGTTTICTATVSATGTWTCTPTTPLPVGSHTITATSNGATSMATLVVQCTTNTQCSGSTPVCNTASHACVAASVALTSPPAGSSANTTDTTPTLTGTGVPGSTVTVTDGTTTICTATVSAAGTWTCTPTTPLSIGSHMLSATSDGAMSSGTLVVQCTMNTQCSGATPVCNTTLGACVGTSLTLVNPPANGTAMTTNPTPDITGTGSAGFTVTVTDGTTTLCTAVVASNGTWTCTSSMLAPGSHTITATSGTATTMGTLVELCTLNAQCAGATPVCNTATGACVMDALTMTTPPQNGSANTTNTMPAISGTGIPGQMVVVTDGSTTLCTATVDATGMWSCTPTSALPIGMHTITATSGTTTASGTIVVQCTLDAQCSGATPACNTATGACVPAGVGLTNPMAGGTTHSSDTMPAITGTGVPGATVTVSEGGTTLCTAMVDASGMWSCTPTSAFSLGNHTILATSDGATSTGTLTIDCTRDAQCSGATPVCLESTSTCVQCVLDVNCSGATPRCETSSHTCVPACLSNTDCPSGSHCDTTAQMCIADVDAGVDAGSDAASDVATDVTNDVARDASSDVARDASSDVANDVARDATGDVASDVATDARRDAANDGNSTDVALGDAGGDAAPRSLTGNGSCGCRTVGGDTSHSRGTGLLAALGAVAMVQTRRRRRARAA